MGKRKEVDVPALIKPDASESFLRHRKRRRSDEDEDSSSVALSLLRLRAGQMGKPNPFSEGKSGQDDSQVKPEGIRHLMQLKGCVSHVTDDEEEMVQQPASVTTRRSRPSPCNQLLPAGCRGLPMPPPLAASERLLQPKGFAVRRLPRGRPLPPAPRLPNFLLKIASSSKPKD